MSFKLKANNIELWRMLMACGYMAGEHEVEANRALAQVVERRPDIVEKLTAAFRIGSK